MDMSVLMGANVANEVRLRVRVRVTVTVRVRLRVTGEGAVDGAALSGGALGAMAGCGGAMLGMRATSAAWQRRASSAPSAIP